MGPSDEVKAAASDLLEHCDIADVRPSRIDAQALGETPEQIATVSFSPTLEHASGEGIFRNRFTFAFSFDDATERPVATMEFVLLVEWSVPEDYTPNAEAAEFVASTTGYFAAFPYARELVQSMTTRLGLDPLVLGTLKRGELRPESVRVVVRNVAPAKIGESDLESQTVLEDRPAQQAPITH